MRELGCFRSTLSPFPRKVLLYKFGWLTLKPLLTLQAAKMNRFTIIGDFELGCILVQNHAADWVSKHFLGSCPQRKLDYVPFMVVGLKKADNRRILCF